MLAYRHGFQKRFWTAELKGGAIEALNDKPGLFPWTLQRMSKLDSG